MKALGIAATGMLAQQTNVDVIANNIANANTYGSRHGFFCQWGVGNLQPLEQGSF